MPDKEKDHIDNFIKKVLEGYDVQYEEPHWEALEAQLDQELPVEKKPYNQYYVISNIITGFALLLYLLRPGYFEMTGKDHLDRNPFVSNPKELFVVPDEIEDKAEHLEEKASDKPEDRTNSKLPETKTRENQEVEKSTVVNREGDKVPDQSNKFDKENLVGQEKPEWSPTLKAPSKEGGRGLAPVQEKKTTFVFPDSTEYSSKILLAKEEENPKYSMFVPEKCPGLACKEHPVAIDFPNEIYTETGTSIEEKSQDKPENSLSIGVSLAPDFNSVGLDQQKKYSGKLGINVQYSVHNRWILSAGILYNRKKYLTTGERYVPPYGYWKSKTNGIVPENVDGHCGVVDIPLKLGYNWTAKSKIHLITSLGVSTYILLDEYYEFEFTSPNPGAAGGWGTEDNSKVVAGLANVSLAAEWPLSQRFSLRVEPYLIVPLKKVGWGKVDLYSTGTLFSILYRLK
ncbi:hypothetical protein AAG747_23675 [Rapidithrix thailandica]|uniref:Outer membrane protein beta-barrel domain-containing protein n=1 Tax=Rapidithrix thailandica TaxID=413964 RepID=A0AAW9SJQ8_9BACT